MVRRVAPVLIDQGRYRWPWLGVNQPTSVNLILQEANDLETQDGVYVHQVVPNGPAAQAGLQGRANSITMNGLEIPTGGDVIVAVNGESLRGLDQLLEEIAFSNLGEALELTIVRDGERQVLTVVLEARPQEFN